MSLSLNRVETQTENEKHQTEKQNHENHQGAASGKGSRVEISSVKDTQLREVDAAGRAVNFRYMYEKVINSSGREPRLSGEEPMMSGREPIMSGKELLGSLICLARS